MDNRSNYINKSEQELNNDKNILLSNLDKLHTTKLGEERIKRCLIINDNNIIDYLKNMILNEKAIIYRQGKNYYCEIDKFRITVNSSNYCIITLHII